MGSSSVKKNEVLKNVFAAVEPPVANECVPLNRFLATIGLYQDAKILPQVSVVSLIHSSLYMVPTAWYHDNEDRYAAEARSKVIEACNFRFNYNSVNVLKSKASANHFLIEHLSKFLSSQHSDLLVVLASNRKGIPYWLLGSFAETAALTCAASVLVIKSPPKLELSVKPRLTVAIDASAKYTSRDIKWLIALAHPGQVTLDLISVRPKPISVLSSLRKPKHPRLAENEIKTINRELNKAGISTTLTFCKEEKSIAETIIEFSDKKKAWGIITISTERSFARRLLLGSTARRILMLSQRPFFSIRNK